MNRVKFAVVAAAFVMFPLVFCAGADAAKKPDPAAQQWTKGTKNTTLTKKVGTAYVNFVFGDDPSVYTLGWGNGSVQNVSKDQFKVLANGILDVADYNDRVIVLEQGCGTDCHYYVVLPLKADAAEKKYAPAFIYDLAQSFVAYDVSQTDPGVAFRIENFENGAYMDLYKKDLLTAEGEYIDVFRFEPDKFVMEIRVAGADADDPPRTLEILLK